MTNRERELLQNSPAWQTSYGRLLLDTLVDIAKVSEDDPAVHCQHVEIFACPDPECGLAMKAERFGSERTIVHDKPWCAGFGRWHEDFA